LRSFGVSAARQTVANYLKGADIAFGRGQRQHKDHDAPHVVAHRHKFMAYWLKNVTNDYFPKKPLCYIDESYLNQINTPTESWHIKRVPVSQHTGVGPRFCILGAIVYYTNDSHGRMRLCAEWVPDAFKFWPAARKESTTTPSDYHGNVNAEKFSKWFEETCITLRDTVGDTEIYMDGAAYHKTRIDPPPTKSSTKRTMLDFLEKHAVPCTDAMTKDALYDLIKASPHSVVRYQCVEIAKNYGHNVSFLPAYHCELNPIEAVWNALKQPIKAMKKQKMAELGVTLQTSYENVGERKMIKAWNRAMKEYEKFKNELKVAVLEVASDAGSEIEEDED
jgi:hypothetical protein